MLLKQEGNAMFSVDLSIREGDGHVIVVLGGLESIDSSGVAALARGRKLARHAAGDLLLAAPQHQVLRVLTLTRLIDVFPVYASVDEAARTAGLTRQAAAPVDGSPARVAVT